MNGVTRFLQIEPSDANDTRARWLYDKTEDAAKLLDPAFWEQFDYALTEAPERVIGEWEIIDTVYGYVGVTVLKPGDADQEVITTALPLCSHNTPLSTGNGVDSVRQAAWRSRGCAAWMAVERWLRGNVTHGWWVGVRMEPRIRVLQRQKDGAGVGMM